MKNHNSIKTNPETLFDKITDARKVLGIPEEASIETIKDAFKENILIWHPDKCKEPLEDCQKKATELINAYKVITDFCAHYKFSFSQQTVDAHAPYEEMWLKLYGHDPMWGPTE